MEQNEKSGKLLEVKDLRVSFFTPAGEVKAVSGISYDLDYDEVMGIVGESGSGKSQEAYSIMGLLRSMPRVDAESYERLIPIEGTPVDMLNPPEGCPFAPRCEHAMKICLQKMPPYVELGEGHRSACWLRVQDQLDKAGQEKPVQDQEVSGRE